MKRSDLSLVQRPIRRLGFALGTFAVAAALLSACNILVNDAPLDPEGGIDAADEATNARRDASRDAGNDGCAVVEPELEGDAGDGGDASKGGDAADGSNGADAGAVDPCALPVAPRDAATDGPRDAAKDG